MGRKHFLRRHRQRLIFRLILRHLARTSLGSDGGACLPFRRLLLLLWIVRFHMPLQMARPRESPIANLADLGRFAVLLLMPIKVGRVPGRIGATGFGADKVLFAGMGPFVGDW